MYIASYLIGSTGIRIKSPAEGRHQILWLPNGPPSRGINKPKMLADRVDTVFQLVPDRIKTLIIINSNMSGFELIQAAVEVAEKYADNVLVIPLIVARLMYALDPLAEFRNPPKDEVILIVTVAEPFTEFVILRRDLDFELYIDEYRSYSDPNQFTKVFLQYYEEFLPHATVFVVHEKYLKAAEKLRDDLRPQNCFVRFFRRWDFMHLFGGIFRAMDDEYGFDPRYHIANCSNGIEAFICEQGRRSIQRILKERTRIPCKIYGLETEVQAPQLFYTQEYMQEYEKLVNHRKEASKTLVALNGSAAQVIGEIDERGVTHLKTFVKEQPVQDQCPKNDNTSPMPLKQPMKVSTIQKRPIEVECIQLALDLSTGNILEYNSKTTKFSKSYFDPDLPSSSTVNPYTSLINTLQGKSLSSLYILLEKPMHPEDKKLFNVVCNSVTFIPRIKAQLSFCFKKIKIDESVDNFAIVLTTPHQLMDVYIFEYHNQQYFFLHRILDLTAEDAASIIQGDFVKNVYMFYPKGKQFSLDLPFEIQIYIVPEYESSALTGAFELNQTEKYFGVNEESRALFNVSNIEALGNCGYSPPPQEQIPYNNERKSPSKEAASSSSYSATNFQRPKREGTEANGRNTTDTGIYSQTSSPFGEDGNTAVDVTVSFTTEWCAIEVYQNGKTRMIQNSYGNDWTPLYLSMAEGKLEVGEKAQQDFGKSPKSVIFDVMKIIGKKLNEIKIERKWGFELTETEDGIIYFQIETPKGPRRIPQESVLSIFLKFLKLSLESSNLDIESVKEIRLSTETKLSESQKAIFRKAADKIGLEITLFLC